MNAKETQITKVLILGSTGMLGSACSKVFSTDPRFDLIKTSRIGEDGTQIFDARKDSLSELIEKNKPDWIINCIGIIKPHIDEKDLNSSLNAILVNSIFPHQLASTILGTDTKVIQIATDCVYSGEGGYYLENSPHDPTDIYGKTKSLGEVPSSQFVHIRASIIGPEVGRATSLLEWFLAQPRGARLNGFTDHLWNGITTHHFGLLAKAIITENYQVSGTHHVIPGDVVTKAELLEIFSRIYNRSDIEISPVISTRKINRTLATELPETSNKLWELAGYTSAPSISQMVEEQFLFNQNP